MALPLIPLLKILALGSVKIVFLLLGAAFFPVFSLKFILTGAYGMLLPTLDWLEANNRLDRNRHTAIVDDLNALSQIAFTRPEARHQLLTLTRNTLSGMVAAVVGIPDSIRRVVTFVVGKRRD